MTKFKNLSKVEHFTMELPQVKNKVNKTEKKIEVDKIFDKSGGSSVKMAPKSKKKTQNNMSLSFYNYRSKKYSKENS